MIRLVKDMHRHPHGGHHYPQDGHTFTADSVEELCQQIEEYRLENGKPVGNPMRDVTLYYAKVSPWMVEESEELDDQEQQDYQDRAIVWLRNLYLAGAIKQVEKEVGYARLGVCRVCSHNSAWGDGSEALDAQRREFLVLGGRIDKKCGVCRKNEKPCNVWAWMQSGECPEWPNQSPH